MKKNNDQVNDQVNDKFTIPGENTESYSTSVRCARHHLLSTLARVVETLFPLCNYRFQMDSFPFTTPSYEIEVEYKGKWMEILGCGIVHSDIMKRCKLDGQTAWAFGLGLDRLAMKFFDIPDIRLLWSDRLEFLNQWTTNQDNIYKPIFSLAPVTHNLSFWIPENFMENDFFDFIREIVDEKSGTTVSEVERYDTFTNPKSGKTAYGYKIVFAPTRAEDKNAGEFKAITVESLKFITTNVIDKFNLVQK